MDETDRPPDVETGRQELIADTKSTVEGGQIQRITQPPNPAMEQGGTCSCPSETGAALCSTKAQAALAGCPRPSDRPNWCPWYTCDDWKSWRLLEETEMAVAKDPDCHCPAQGRHCHNSRGGAPQEVGQP